MVQHESHVVWLFHSEACMNRDSWQCRCQSLPMGSRRRGIFAPWSWQSQLSSPPLKDHHRYPARKQHISVFRQSQMPRDWKSLKDSRLLFSIDFCPDWGLQALSTTHNIHESHRATAEVGLSGEVASAPRTGCLMAWRLGNICRRY